jgi:hypothetical protein
MINLLRGAVVVVVAAVLLAFCALLPPKRWMDIHPGLRRAQVHAVLGAPYADYFAVKSFDGWAQGSYLGLSTLTVVYAENSDIVESTRWGICTMQFAYCMHLPPGGVAIWRRASGSGAPRSGSSA